MNRYKENECNAKVGEKIIHKVDLTASYKNLQVKKPLVETN